MPKRYIEQTKLEAVGRLNSGESAESLCEQYGMSRSTLYEWRRQYAPTDQGRTTREIYLLEVELARLREENIIFRESGCSPASPLNIRLAAIDRLKDQYSIHALCRTLEVLRSTYYHRAKRSPDETIIEQQDKNLTPAITDIFEKSRQTFGARRIRAKLMMDYGFIVSERRIHRLMKELNLSKPKGARTPNAAYDRQYKYYPNKLKRNFLAETPNQVWVSDITYVKVGETFHYLCVILDLYARKVVAYGISDKMDTGLACNVFTEAFKDRGNPDGLIFHSDQGGQYASVRFRKLLRKNGVKPSYSAPGTPYDNAVVESFFATIKKEEYRRRTYDTVDELNAATKSYMEFYNDYRSHHRLGNLSPNQAEDEYYNNI